MIKKFFVPVLLAVICWTGAQATDYKASAFGIESNGATLNTRSIQKAINYIHENGGGRLMFSVGRYLTGSVELKSNVTLYLNTGAVLVGSTNPYDYDACAGWLALIYAKNAENIGIVGRGGVIDGQGRETSYKFIDQIHKKFIKDELRYDRPAARPTLVYLRECTHVAIDDILLKNSAFWVQIYDQCKDVSINKVSVDSKAFWNNDGIDIVDCDGLLLTNSFLDATDDAICLKSHDPKALCQNITIRNCVARSSASGVKFGTASNGGFKNIKLSNITVYDTYRSAFTIQAVDGGIAENISIDSLYAYNTGNIIFLRVGDRHSGGRKASMNNIRISNVYAETAEGKPDEGYEYEGPIEDLPRNISPCGIVGLKGQEISNVHLTNVHIVSPGGGNPLYAKAGLTPAELDAIPEMPAAYPEFSQFKELPAWGFYIRHAQGIVFENVTLSAKKADYRPAIVLDDVKDSNFKQTIYIEPRKKQSQLHIYQSTGITK
jgi:polygalacturonase